jgi:putative YhbY family RNA-binding protein
LHPLVAIGNNGLTPAVLKEIGLCLNAHELIKVKLHGIEREHRDALLEQICTELMCAPVQHIGNTLILWREKPETEAPPAQKPRRKVTPRTKKQAAAASERSQRRSTRT